MQLKPSEINYIKASTIEQVCCVPVPRLIHGEQNEVKNIILTYRKSIRHRTVHLHWI